jgi:hypothetical protein
MVNMLERFGGYTLQTLRDEDAELIQMMAMVDSERARKEERSGE